MPRRWRRGNERWRAWPDRLLAGKATRSRGGRRRGNSDDADAHVLTASAAIGVNHELAAIGRRRIANAIGVSIRHAAIGRAKNTEKRHRTARQQLS